MGAYAAQGERADLAFSQQVVQGDTQLLCVGGLIQIECVDTALADWGRRRFLIVRVGSSHSRESGFVQLLDKIIGGSPIHDRNVAGDALER